MTAITGKVQSVRRPGELGIHSMDAFALTVPDLRVAEDFCRAFGLGPREEGEGLYAFGSDHHLIVFAKSSAPGMRRCNWDVGSIDEIGKGAMQVADGGFTRGRGLARCVLGANCCHEVRDPWGSCSEYSADIDCIPADQDWQASDHPPEDSVYLRRPEIPKDFVHNYEAGPG